jgi:predicted CoA-substrate-specific enzyme activase
MSASVGLDSGSSACKGVLIKDNRIIDMLVRPTGWNPKETSEQILSELLKKSGTAREETTVVATGYGRIGLDFADRQVTEITCHARGAEFLLPGVRTVIDIGGQDSKAIAVKDGRVLAFQMNDKCAAGTGRFVEMSAHRMGLGLDCFAELLEAGKSVSLSSMCAVFADSEIVSLLASGKSREELAGGIITAVASRAVTLLAKVDIEAPILLTGGLSDLKRLRDILSEQVGAPVTSSPHSRYAGAIGAALVGADVKK